MSTGFSGCLPFCVRLVLSYYSVFSLWRNNYDDDDDGMSETVVYQGELVSVAVGGLR